MVKLVGHILRDTGRDILLEILPNNGDAARVGLTGQEWFGKRQIVIHPATSDGFDVIGVPYELAKYKAQAQAARRQNQGGS